MVELRNLTDHPLLADIHLRFFDDRFETEYEKIPVKLQERLPVEEAKRVEATVDFRGLPDARKISKVGISITVRK